MPTTRGLPSGKSSIRFLNKLQATEQGHGFWLWTSQCNKKPFELHGAMTTHIQTQRFRLSFERVTFKCPALLTPAYTYTGVHLDDSLNSSILRLPSLFQINGKRSKLLIRQSNLRSCRSDCCHFNSGTKNTKNISENCLPDQDGHPDAWAAYGIPKFWQGDMTRHAARRPASTQKRCTRASCPRKCWEKSWWRNPMLRYRYSAVSACNV